MGTKLDPGPGDCYARALPDEPMFVLLARDRIAGFLTSIWSAVRMADEKKARVVFETMLERAGPVYWAEPDVGKGFEAMDCSLAMFRWREAHDGCWREPISAPAHSGIAGRARLLELRADGRALIELDGESVLMKAWTGARMPLLGPDPRDPRRGLIAFEGGAADAGDGADDTVCVSVSADGIEAMGRDLVYYAEQLRRQLVIDPRSVI